MEVLAWKLSPVARISSSSGSNYWLDDSMHVARDWQLLARRQHACRQRLFLFLKIHVQSLCNESIITHLIKYWQVIWSEQPLFGEGSWTNQNARSGDAEQRDRDSTRRLGWKQVRARYGQHNNAIRPWQECDWCLDCSTMTMDLCDCIHWAWRHDWCCLPKEHIRVACRWRHKLVI